MSARDAFAQKCRAKSRQLQADINRLEAKADEVDAETRLRYQAEIVDLKRRRDEADRKLEQLMTSSGNAWNDLRAGVEHAWDNLADAVRRAEARFR